MGEVHIELIHLVHNQLLSLEPKAWRILTQYVGRHSLASTAYPVSPTLLPESHDIKPPAPCFFSALYLSLPFILQRMLSLF